MPEPNKPLGRIIAVHALAPEHVQRAVFIAVLSFVFFLTMMIAFYIRENFIYFLLSSAFLVVYLFTLFSWFTQRRSVATVYENGLTYRGRSVLWTEIEAITDNGEIAVRNEKPLTLPKNLYKFEELPQTLRDSGNASHRRPAPKALEPA